MVEFGLVMLVFFALLFGIIQGGLIFGSWIVVTNAAREGARFGSVCISRAELSETLGNTALCSEGTWSPTNPATNNASIAAHTRNAIVWPSPGDADYDMQFAVNYQTTGDPRLVTVRVDYRMPILFPLVRDESGRFGAGNKFPLGAESAMRIEE